MNLGASIFVGLSLEIDPKTVEQLIPPNQNTPTNPIALGIDLNISALPQFCRIDFHESLGSTIFDGIVSVNRF